MKSRGSVVQIKSVVIAVGFLSLVSYIVTTFASSEAGLDVTFKPVQVRVLYSVALDYEKAEDCIRDPRCLLFDIIALFQTHSSRPNSQLEVFQFELYQSSKKAGNFLSLVRDPFEGGHYKTLYDGRANKDLRRQIMSLLRRHMKLPLSKEDQPSYIKLYKCTGTKGCNDIMIGSFPSEKMHTGYCATPDMGCDSKFISVSREEMQNYFSSR